MFNFLVHIQPFGFGKERNRGILIRDISKSTFRVTLMWKTVLIFFVLGEKYMKRLPPERFTVAVRYGQ